MFIIKIILLPLRSPTEKIIIEMFVNWTTREESNMIIFCIRRIHLGYLCFNMVYFYKERARFDSIVRGILDEEATIYRVK